MLASLGKVRIAPMAKISEGALTDKLASILEKTPAAMQKRILRSLCDRLAPDMLETSGGRGRDEDDDGLESKADHAKRRSAGLGGVDVSDLHSSGRRARGNVLSYETSLGGAGAVDLDAFDAECDRILSGS